MYTTTVILFTLAVILAYETAGPLIAFRKNVSKLRKNKRLTPLGVKTVSWFTSLLECSLCTGFWLAIPIYFLFPFINFFLF